MKANGQESAWFATEDWALQINVQEKELGSFHIEVRTNRGREATLVIDRAGVAIDVTEGQTSAVEFTDDIGGIRR